MPTLDDDNWFERDKYNDMFNEDDNRNYDAKPPDLQDTGFTINFKNSDNQDRDAKILKYYQKYGGDQMTNEDLQQMERRVRKDKEEDAMSVDFHGMHFNFNRDHDPNSYSAAYSNDYNEYGQQQQEQYYLYDYYQHENPLLYNISYILPFIICGTLICCLLSFLYCIIGYYGNKWIKLQILKSKNKKYEFKGIPNIDPEDEEQEEEEKSDDNDPQIV